MSDAASKKVKPLKIVLWSILGAVLLFVCIVLGSLLVQKYIKKSRVPMFAGYASLVVTTGSMNGTIDQGDMIIIKRTNDYKRTDIVTFIKNGEVITHRIVNYYDPATGDVSVEYTGMFLTKGDANDGTDELLLGPVSEDEIVGEWVSTIPKAGIFIEWFTHEGGIIYLVALIAIAFAGVYLWGALKPEEETAAEGGETPEGSESPEGEQVAPEVGEMPKEEESENDGQN